MYMININEKAAYIRWRGLCEAYLMRKHGVRSKQLSYQNDFWEDLFHTGLMPADAAIIAYTTAKTLGGCDEL